MFLSFFQKIKERQDAGMKINKLSYRRRAMSTPSLEVMKAREASFVNDAIITEKMRTRFRDVIPVYDACNDRHCVTYFTRPDVQRLIKVTRSPRKSRDYGTRKDVIDIRQSCKT